MFASTEIRWFFAGPASADGRAWFAAFGPDEPPAERTDRYLRLPGIDSLGIKLREGMLEIKHRETVGTVETLAPEMAGAIETWRKWGFKLCEVDNDLKAMMTPAAAWVDVRKRRWLRLFSRCAGDVLGVGCETAAPLGHFELTEIECLGQTWWTVGFECYGSGPEHRVMLRRMLAHAVATAPPPTLPAAACCGYAAFLQTLNENGKNAEIGESRNVATPFT